MATILLAIKPEFVERIFSGDKKFEFRRSIARRAVDKIVIYATRPVCAVVGAVDVCGVISGAPDYVWTKTCDFAGIEREFFDSYFNGRNVSYAYKLGHVVRFEVPRSLSEFGVRTAPQSFIYVDEYGHL